VTNNETIPVKKVVVELQVGIHVPENVIAPQGGTNEQFVEYYRYVNDLLCRKIVGALMEGHKSTEEVFAQGVPETYTVTQNEDVVILSAFHKTTDQSPDEPWVWF
jgi:hypothetical protein